MTRIEVYVQLGVAAEKFTVFSVWGDAQKTTCQRLANRMKAEVRAIQNDKELARFYPDRVECSEGC